MPSTENMLLLVLPPGPNLRHLVSWALCQGRVAGIALRLALDEHR